jgi:hypothetical protein
VSAPKTMKERALIFIGSEQKGLLISFAKLLESRYGYEVCIIARDKYVKNLVDKLLPNREGDIVLSDIKFNVDNVDILHESLYIEKKYNINLSMIASDDRAIGQGYLHNVDKIPDIIRSSWSHKKKLKEIIRTIKIKESIIDRCDIVIQLTPDKIVSMIGRSIGSKVFSPQIIKFGDRVFWSDNDFSTSSKYIERLVNNLDCKIDDYNIIYKIESSGDRINSSESYTYISSTMQAAKIFINDTKNYLRGIHKKNSYHYLGWVPSLYRKVSNYRYVHNISYNFEDLKGLKVIFFPLHLEPEVALLNLSPEFTNSMELISLVSKSIPSDTMLVVKEQSQSFGVRSRWYYEHINKIGNVVWADPTIHSWKWIERSSVVATITGTVGVEAVNFNKPVVSFGKHQIINHLPTVYYVTNYKETSKVFNLLLSHPVDRTELNISRSSLSKAQYESSIDLPEYKDLYGSVKLEDSVAMKALKFLSDEYLN